MSDELKAIREAIQSLQREERFLAVVDVRDKALLLLSRVLEHLMPDDPDMIDKLEEIRQRHVEEDYFLQRTNSNPPRKNAWAAAHRDRATLLSALTASEARVKAAEARVGDLEEAAEKAIKHADRRGMGDWPIFKNLARTLKGTPDGR